jgi:hypothetical protein
MGRRNRTYGIWILLLPLCSSSSSVFRVWSSRVWRSDSESPLVSHSGTEIVTMRSVNWNIRAVRYRRKPVSPKRSLLFLLSLTSCWWRCGHSIQLHKDVRCEFFFLIFWVLFFVSCKICVSRYLFCWRRDYCSWKFCAMFQIAFGRDEEFV